MKQDTKKYVKYLMCSAKPEDLMEELESLNLNELRMVQGCGVPGEAWTYCNELIRKRKKEVHALIMEQGAKASMSVETGSDGESENDGTSSIRTSESR